MKIYSAWWISDRFGRHVRCATRCQAPDMDRYRANAAARRGATIIGVPYPARCRDK